MIVRKIFITCVEAESTRMQSHRLHRFLEVHMTKVSRCF